MPDPKPITPFSTWLAQHARGTLDNELTAALAETIAATNDLEEDGVVVLKLRVKSAGGGHRTVTIEGEVETKPPKPKPERSLFYVGDNGRVYLEDPYQTRLDTGDARTVDPATGKAAPTTRNGDPDA